MIDKELLVKTVIEAISGTDLFLVEAKVGSSNDINIEIDSASGVDIDTCARITRRIEEVFDREAEDYSLGRPYIAFQGAPPVREERGQRC